MKLNALATAIGATLFWMLSTGTVMALTEAECQKIYDRDMADINNPRIYSARNAKRETEGALRVCLAKVEEYRLRHEAEERQAQEYQQRKAISDAINQQRAEQLRQEREATAEAARQAQAEIQAKRAEEESQRRKKQAEEDAIKAAPEYKRQEAERQIQLSRQAIERLNNQLKMERTIEMRSGVVNASRVYALNKEIYLQEEHIEMQQAVVKRMTAEINSSKKK